METQVTLGIAQPLLLARGKAARTPLPSRTPRYSSCSDASPRGLARDCRNANAERWPLSRLGCSSCSAVDPARWVDGRLMTCPQCTQDEPFRVARGGIHGGNHLRRSDEQLGRAVAPTGRGLNRPTVSSFRWSSCPHPLSSNRPGSRSRTRKLSAGSESGAAWRRCPQLGTSRWSWDPR
jgi:hypothetical protein